MEGGVYCNNTEADVIKSSDVLIQLETTLLNTFSDINVLKNPYFLQGIGNGIARTLNLSTIAEAGARLPKFGTLANNEVKFDEILVPDPTEPRKGSVPNYSGADEPDPDNDFDGISSEFDADEMEA